ncbi:hypothetical protein OHA79_07940 [Streptomyces sp. NBC_00841]|uniref:hypothetical protein n=1 Tax=unclassified Streptomyces TaxID=2593676 RepID=UPI002251224C|nr:MULTISPECIES: hypothetical protein [unclassified Streptomyces]MCX4536961.1 hypothetical protein [Streptomyces sp. NBC_01669]WRZ97788.1 hypothetical protein OHA79_07940 [Streptomyces sp. NBC_00841]
MRSTRISISAGMLGSLVLPIASATAATATPSAVPSSAQSALPTIRDCDRPGLWAIGTRAVTIRSKPTTGPPPSESSTA